MSIPGGWDYVKMSACALPEDVASAFSQTLGRLMGAEYVPVLYCGKQVVEGTNYLLICQQTLVTKPRTIHMVKVILYKPLENETDKECSIVSIIEI